MYRIYTRISSRKQSTDCQDGDLSRFRADMIARGERAKLYEPDKCTGKVMQRPVWNRLWDESKAGDVVVVWSLSRLGRTSLGLLNLLEEAKGRGVFLLILKEGIDTRTPSIAQKLLFTILAAVAEIETEQRAERIAAARETKIRNGTLRKCGRKKGTPVKLHPEVCDTIRLLHGNGQKVSHIARSLKLSRPSIYSVLRS